MTSLIGHDLGLLTIRLKIKPIKTYLSIEYCFDFRKFVQLTTELTTTKNDHHKSRMLGHF